MASNRTPTVRVYGRSVGDDGSGDPLTMSEVTVMAEPEALRVLASFLLTCADEIETEPGWDHEHISRSDHGLDSECDFIVFRAQEVATDTEI